jgi:hypothetical protein
LRWAFHRAGECQPHVVIAAVGLNAQAQAVPVETERPDPAASQRPRQVLSELVHDVGMVGFEVP